LRAAGDHRPETELLDANPLLKRSIRNRFPYLDPLNHIQVELLRRHRAGHRRPRAARHPPHDQRRRRGPAQQRLKPPAARDKYDGIGVSAGPIFRKLPNSAQQHGMRLCLN
jgi:hypothetical protein